MQRLVPAAAIAAALATALLAGVSAHALRLPGARRCPGFPANNAWNQRVDKLPVASDSTQLIASIGLDAPVPAAFGPRAGLRRTRRGCRSSPDSRAGTRPRVA